MVAGLFDLEHNREEAARQEYELAKQHYDFVNAHRNVFNPEHTQKFRDARDRLNKAHSLLLDLVRDEW
jgi:hypothetical protein